MILPFGKAIIAKTSQKMANSRRAGPFDGAGGPAWRVNSDRPGELGFCTVNQGLGDGCATTLIECVATTLRAWTRKS
jgi:hypothetical protein